MFIKRFAFFVVLVFLAAASQGGACLGVAHYGNEERCLNCENAAVPEVKTAAVRKLRPSTEPVARLWIARKNFRERLASDSRIKPSTSSTQHFRVLLI